MTEFLVSQNPSALPAGENWQTQALRVSPEPREINLREALEWLLGTEHDGSLPIEEQTIRKERRTDLLLWLMNLELRLSPYSEPA